MLLLEVLKMQTIEDTMAPVARSIGGAKRLRIVVLQSLQVALLHWQGVSTRPTMDNQPELCLRMGRPLKNSMLTLCGHSNHRR